MCASNDLLCQTNDLLCPLNYLLCQSFHQSAKFFEKYCHKYNGILPCNNNIETPAIDSCQVDRLKIGGCSGEVVWQTLYHFKNIRSLDVSNSAYQILDWLNASSFHLDYLQKFNASHNELTYLRRLLVNASALIEIDVSFNKLRYIDSNSFGQHDKLLRIIVAHNELTFISVDAFKGVPHLKFIDLSDNYLGEVPDMPYSYLIRTIHLERNRIFYLTCPQTNSAMVHLTWTSVYSFYGRDGCDGLQMEIISDSAYEGLSTAEANYQMHFNAHSFRKLYAFIAGRNAFSNVTHLLPFLTALITNLDLSGNYLGAVNKSTFERFDRLMIVSLSDTQLTQFDFQVLRNQNYRLKSLDLSNNGLKHIENVEQLAKFYSLNTLNIAGNKLNNTLELMQSLRSSIKTLDISDNHIRGRLNLTTFERMSSLETLKLRNTNLKVSNFSAIEILKHLREIDLSYNNFTHVNASDFSAFANLSQLIKLNIAYCQLRNVSHVIHALKSKHLKELDISGNHIKTLPKLTTFDSFSHLEYLNLSHTNLLSLNFNLLTNLTHLQVLDITYNKLYDGRFEQLPSSLKHVYLEGNELTNIDNINSEQFPWLKSLSISKNQFSCLTLRNFMSTRKKLYLIGKTLDQKHGKYCSCSVHGILDYLDAVYETVRFW